MLPPIAAPPETEIDALDQHWLWRGERPGYTMLGAHLGRLLLTDRRLLFLSTGSNGIFHQFLFRSVPGTSHLDMSALGRRGSLSLWLERIELSAIGRRRDFASFLVIRTRAAAFSFMSKFGMDRTRLAEFQETLEKQRAARAGDQSLQRS